MGSAALRGIWTFLRFAAVACIAAVLLTLGSAAQGDPPPPDVSLTLGVGASKAFKPTIHFDELPPRADVLLAIDTTGSMGQAITDAKADADTLVQQIQSEIPNAKFALADFKDYPDSGGPAGDYPWRVDQDFTDQRDGLDLHRRRVLRDEDRVRAQSASISAGSQQRRRHRRVLQPGLLRGLQRLAPTCTGTTGRRGSWSFSATRCPTTRP